jgi:hypothetical protein
MSFLLELWQFLRRGRSSGCCDYPCNVGDGRPPGLGPRLGAGAVHLHAFLAAGRVTHADFWESLRITTTPLQRLIVDGRIEYAAQEERSPRVKHDPDFPHEAVSACFEATAASPPTSISCVLTTSRSSSSSVSSKPTSRSPARLHSFRKPALCA